jgi:hypothetical protein
VFFVLIKQITQGKTSLEQALKLAKKLKKESTSLRDFMAFTSKDLSRRDMPTPSKDLEEELAWIKVRILSLPLHCLMTSLVTIILHK